MLSVRLRDDFDDRLNFLAKITKRSKSFYVNELFSRNFHDLEDIYLADAALEEFRNSGEKTVSLKDMRASLDLDD